MTSIVNLHTDFQLVEERVKSAALFIKRELAALEGVHRFTFEINAEGRVDGDVKITYRIGTDYEASVFGDSIGPALIEAKRRKGWNDAHAPKMISHVTGEEI